MRFLNDSTIINTKNFASPALPLLWDLIEEDCKGSWYGPGFHGKKTANGEIFDQMELTAAHKTLPFGSIVKVEDIETGNTVIVRINDRGPFVKGRTIDLSKGAMLALGNRGLKKLRLFLLKNNN